MGRKSLALGRSLDNIFKDRQREETDNIIQEKNKKEGIQVLEINLNLIDPNPFQPRRHFNEDDINELAETIKEHGLIQPITVRKFNGRYQIVSGERRTRAARIAKFETIEAYVHELLSDKNMGEWSLIENIQRVDLNPIEIAQSYQQLIENYGYTHEDLSKSIGKSRSVVTNSIRLLKLPIQVQSWIEEGKLSSSAARSLLSPDITDPEKVAKEIIEKGLNVREAEQIGKNKKEVVKKETHEMDPNMKDFITKLTDFFGTRVSLNSKEKNFSKGSIIIDYYSLEDLNRIQEIMDR
ncbi:MAG TPA: ParB/RepB/Spo0J family partition protein [Fibrobacter sp.]|nr:ParB/RepB/Spo0J family partition protein [Fibrobacter sp.]